MVSPQPGRPAFDGRAGSGQVGYHLAAGSRGQLLEDGQVRLFGQEVHTAVTEGQVDTAAAVVAGERRLVGEERARVADRIRDHLVVNHQPAVRRIGRTDVK